MLINKISLLNYGPFCGENVIHFRKNGNIPSNRNVILIGGKNGCGKTSLFTAIQLCFYGQSALGGRLSKRQYEDYLKGQIHEGTDSVLTSDTASVEIDFDFSVCGNRDNYKVKRTWKCDTSGAVSERLFIQKNDKALDSYEENAWQDFVKYLIPQGLLKLFFFDGERINALTKSDDNYELIDSIHALFGIDIIKQLKADLRYFERKRLGSEKASNMDHKLSEIEEQLLGLQKRREDCEVEIASLNSQIDVKDNEIKKCDEFLRNKGGYFGVSRNEASKKIEQLEAEIKELSKELRDLFQQCLPFYYAGTYADHVISRLRGEHTSRALVSYQAAFEKIWTKSKTKIKILLKLESHLPKLYQLLTDQKIDKPQRLINADLSEIDASEIIKWFDTDAAALMKQAKLIGHEIDSRQSIVSDLLKKMEYLPDDSKVADLIKNVNELSKEKGRMEGLIQHKEDEKKQIGNQIALLTRQKEKINEDIGAIAASDRKLGLIDKSIHVLDKFEQEMLVRKMESLEQNVLSCFNSLIRKGDIIDSISINRDDFRVLLEDKGGRVIDKKKLSEGEKQIYAVSLLSGITRTTKRAFPIIFDTPLGRLDSDHRMNIIHRYFPQASHQLIILSTDTEIDKKYFEEIKPYIAYSYLFDYDSESRKTNIKEGYFWK